MVDHDDDRIGKVQAIYVDDERRRRWAVLDAKPTR